MWPRHKLRCVSPKIKPDEPLYVQTETGQGLLLDPGYP